MIKNVILNYLRRNKLRLYGKLRSSGIVLACACVETQFIASYLKYNLSFVGTSC